MVISEYSTADMNPSGLPGGKIRFAIIMHANQDFVQVLHGSEHDAIRQVRVLPRVGVLVHV